MISTASMANRMKLGSRATFSLSFTLPNVTTGLHLRPSPMV